MHQRHQCGAEGEIVLGVIGRRCKVAEGMRCLGSWENGSGLVENGLEDAGVKRSKRMAACDSGYVGCDCSCVEGQAIGVGESVWGGASRGEKW